MQLVALAFACNYNRVATLQWGDGTDGTQVQRAVERHASGWPFHQLSATASCRTRPTGNNPTAEQAHARDRRRCACRRCCTGWTRSRRAASRTTSMVMWTNHIADGPSHSGDERAPHHLGQRRRLPQDRASSSTPATSPTTSCFNTLITAAIRDKSTAAVDFGKGTGTGMITAMMA